MTDIVKYNYNALEKYVSQEKSIARIKSVEEALAVRKETPTLISMKQDLGIEKARSYIELLILKLNEFVNVAKPMTPRQIRETAELILEEYYFLTFTEVLFVIKEGKLGKYGDISYSISGVKILKWFIAYAEERHDTVEKQNLNERLKNEFGGDERLSPQQKRKEEQIRIKHIISKAKRNGEK